jgi:hypothetical protein
VLPLSRRIDFFCAWQFADSQEQLLRPAIKTTIALSMKSIDIQACRGCSKAECRQCRKRTEFQETFKKDLARLADVTPDEIKIISIVAGSIIVKAEIIGEGASEKVALLERMLAMERSPPKIAGSAVEMTVIANTDGFEYSRLKKTVAVIKFDSVDRAVKRCSLSCSELAVALDTLTNVSVCPVQREVAALTGAR